MYFMKGLAVFVFFTALVGCSGNNKAVIDNKAVMDNYRKNYSVEVEGITETAISDSLPTGTDVTALSRIILNDVATALSNEGLTKNDNKNRYRIKYTISYFGHKWWTSLFSIKAKYIIWYNKQLIDVSTGIVIASTKNEKRDDKDLGALVENVADDIANFALENIK